MSGFFERLHILPIDTSPEAVRDSLGKIAIENAPDACQLIEAYFNAGANPLVPNSKRLFPFHYAQTFEVFSALTRPPGGFMR